MYPPVHLAIGEQREAGVLSTLSGQNLESSYRVWFLGDCVLPRAPTHPEAQATLTDTGCGSRDQTHRRERQRTAPCSLLASTHHDLKITQGHLVVMVQALAEPLVKY
ncbi:hypothetical protein I79_021682 [Cricetulus griseus]|uniref:Uncharacterized protein n=1 Tax=Cricetulus griseus TaxID=10029 RepID=G3IDA6_CRIGR|nr:hypothetical protein I79_021682 [Cricetulus griseus]